MKYLQFISLIPNEYLFINEFKILSNNKNDIIELYNIYIINA